MQFQGHNKSWELDSIGGHDYQSGTQMYKVPYGYIGSGCLLLGCPSV
jgi:hypothetical protein